MAQSDSSFSMSRFEFNQRQFEAYCDGVFDHRTHLDEVERGYLHHAFATIPPVIGDDAPISWKTYGHKIVGDRVAAWQLGIGFQTLLPDDVQWLEIVLAHWLGGAGMSPYRELLTRSQGAGLGWVSPYGQRRLYFLFEHAPDAITGARHERHLAEISLPEFLLGYTFQGSTLVESKTYYYPHRSHWPRLLDAYAPDPRRCQALASEALRLALVVSGQGHPRLQFDISPRHRHRALCALVSPAAVELAGRCAALRPPLALDTIGVTSESASLYFD